ncbi:MAG: pyridoxal-phosphate dependent enzyme [Crocinitomix sp.]|nr:pyridoxal-phosphate dependent enzyme [Crocinitomix sp.]
MLAKLNLPSKLELIDYELFNSFNIKCYIKRDDQIHGEISGNKWRKLNLNIEKYKQGKYDGILTFGGAYSNHIHATAAVGRDAGIPTIGIIRGQELTTTSNATLKAAADAGMQLIFVNREEYSWRYERDYKELLRRQHGNVLVIEEGGANYLGLMGCTAIVAEIDIEPDYYILASGTGTTAAGVLLAVNSEKVISVPVLKKGDFIRDEISSLLTIAGLGEDEIAEKMQQLTLATNYHFGGYGKFNETLISFINEVYKDTGIKLDQVYTGKMFYALCDLVKKGEIPDGSTVVVVHTGGLQGTSSIAELLHFGV